MLPWVARNEVFNRYKGDALLLHLEKKLNQQVIFESSHKSLMLVGVELGLAKH